MGAVEEISLNTLGTASGFVLGDQELFQSVERKKVPEMFVGFGQDMAGIGLGVKDVASRFPEKFLHPLCPCEYFDFLGCIPVGLHAFRQLDPCEFFVQNQDRGARIIPERRPLMPGQDGILGRRCGVLLRVLMPFPNLATKGGQIDSDLQKVVLDIPLKGLLMELFAVAIGVHDYFAREPGNISWKAPKTGLSSLSWFPQW